MHYSFPATSAYRAGMMDYVRGLSLVAWLFLMVVGFWWQRDWFAAIEYETHSRIMLMFQIGFTIAVIGHATLALQKIWSCPFLIPTADDLRAAMLCMFCLLMVLFAPLSLTPTRSAFYALLTWGTLCLCYLLWQGNYELLRKMLVLAGVLMLAFLIFLIYKHGLLRGTVGGINRNRYAHAAFACMVYLMFYKSRLRWPAVLLAIALVFLVNSRGTILMVAGFMGTYLLLMKGWQKSVAVGILGALAVAVVMFVQAGGSSENIIRDRVLRMDDRARGAGTGFTGRVERWKRGYEVFRQSPLVGVGFRSSNARAEGAYSAHSGYINLLMDTGIFGAALVLGAYLFDARRRFYWLRNVRRQFGYEQVPLWLQDSVKINVVMCSLYVVMAGMMIYEPVYLHLGSTFTVMFLIFLCSPLELTVRQPDQMWSHRYQPLPARS